MLRPRSSGSSFVECPLCSRSFHTSVIQQHAESCVGLLAKTCSSKRADEAPAAAKPTKTARTSERAAQGRQSPIEGFLTKPNIVSISSITRTGDDAAAATPQQPSNDAALLDLTAPSPLKATSASASVPAAPLIARPSATRWGALVDAERRRMLEDPSASVRRTTLQWLTCQRADARCFTKYYASPFADGRPPGSSSDNLRDGPYRAMQRAATSGEGSGRRTSAQTAALQRSNLLLVCRFALDNPARMALPASTARVAAAVLSAPPAAQVLLSQLYYRRGDWHRLTKLADSTHQTSVALQRSLDALCEAGLARSSAAKVEAEDFAALLWLLDADEVKGLGRAAMKKKDKKDHSEMGLRGRSARFGLSSSRSALEKLRRVSELLQDIRSQILPSPLWAELLRRLGSCAALSVSGSMELWRLHVLFFTLSNYTAEEATCMLARDISEIPFPVSTPMLSRYDDDTQTGAAVAPMSFGEDATAGFCRLCEAVECCSRLEWAVVHGDPDAAYSAMHEASNALLSLDEIQPAARKPPLGDIFAMKTQGWWVRVVVSAVHLLEREKRWDDALHYLELLLGINQASTYIAASSGGSSAGGSVASAADMERWATQVPNHVRGAVWVRYGIDLEHRNMPEKALKAYEAALADEAVCGEYRVACARSYRRLWKPPRRWGTIRNCPSFATCPTFMLRGRRLPSEQAHSGRDRGGGWLPIRYVDGEQATSRDHIEIDGSTVDGLWLTDKTGENCVPTADGPMLQPNAPPAAASAAGLEFSAKRDLDKGSVSSVEEYVRRHYIALGFEGFHCENRLFLTLFGLLFWDIIHMPLATCGDGDNHRVAARPKPLAIHVPPFTSAYQDTPHDLNCASFVSRRKAAVEARLADIRHGFAGEIVRRVWERHYGEQSLYVQWDWRDSQIDAATAKRREEKVRRQKGAVDGDGNAETEANDDASPATSLDPEQAMSNLKTQAVEEIVGLCGGFGPEALAGMCSLYAQSYLTWAGGLPDLLIWRVHDERLWEVKLVEVKGPGDSLSHRQRAWIDQLVKWRVPVVVCHVVAEND